jgi:hypothetical protein
MGATTKPSHKPISAKTPAAAAHQGHKVLLKRKKFCGAA